MKRKHTSTITTAQKLPKVAQNEDEPVCQSGDKGQALELFPNFDHDDDIPDDEILNILTQIESENKEIAGRPQEDTTKNVNNTINFANIANVSQMTRQPLLPAMYFPNSNVTINYNFSK